MRTFKRGPDAAHDRKVASPESRRRTLLVAVLTVVAAQLAPLWDARGGLVLADGKKGGRHGAGSDDAEQECTPGYDPCIPPGPDVDCAGGSGNGPRYVQGPIRVTGSDPYRLDRDGDGIACE